MESLHMDLVALFQWLLKTTLQGSLLIGLILAIKLLLRERLSPRWQYSLWLVLLLRLALPWAPQSRLSIYNVIPRSLPSGLVSRGPAQDVQADEAGTKVHSPGRQGAPGSTLVAARDEASRSGADQAAASERSTTTTRANDGRSAAGRRSFTESATALAPWLWLGGCLVLGGYVLCRAFGLWRAVTSERPVTDQEILELLEDCKMQMRIRTIVGVVVTDRTRTPALFGFVRPRILLPQGLIEAFSLDDLHHVFLHELAHLKRRDIYLSWLVCLLGVLHWFNPLMWWAFRRMRADQEMAADALALSTAGVAESRRYGQTIVDLLERFSRPQYLPSLAGILESPSHIERRIAMIAQFSNNSYRWSLVGLTVITVLGTISMIDPTRGAAPASQPAPASPAVTMRAVEKDANAYSYVGVSPDGRYLCGLDTWRARGEIAIREVATGAERVIKPTKETSQESGPRCPVMSPDNKMIAYLVQRPGETDDDLQSADLRLIGVDGSGQRVLCRGAVSEGRVVQLAPKPIQWFPDGSRLLALGWPDRFHASESIEIVSVSIEDGTVQVIKKLTGSFSRARIRLSPDGNCVAYELPSRDAPEKHDIFALDLDAQQETLLVGHAAEDKLLDWTPDGRHILFSSDRLGPWSVWLLPVARAGRRGHQNWSCKVPAT